MGRQFIPSILHRRRSVKVQQFTLVELLMVISIIAILTSLLLPALKKAKDHSKQSLCASNLRHMSMTVYQYADDYDGWDIPMTPTSGCIWSDLVASMYLNIVPRDGAMFDWRARQKGTNYIIYCPGSPYKKGDYKYSDYGRNHLMGDKKIISYHNPSKRFYITDSDGGSSDRVYRPSSSDTVTNHFMAYHLGKANLVFIDGHVGFIRPANVPPYDLLVDGKNPYPW